MRLLAPAEPSVSRPQDRRKITVRLNGIQAAITVVFAVLALAFWYFQVVQHAKFRELAENNHQRTLSLRAPPTPPTLAQSAHAPFADLYRFSIVAVDEPRVAATIGGCWSYYASWDVAREL